MTERLEKLSGFESYEEFNSKFVADLSDFLILTETKEVLDRYSQLVDKYDLLPAVAREGSAEPELDASVKIQRLTTELNELDTKAEVALFKARNEEEYIRLVNIKLLAKVYRKILDVVAHNKAKTKSKKK